MVSSLCWALYAILRVLFFAYSTAALIRSFVLIKNPHGKFHQEEVTGQLIIFRKQSSLFSSEQFLCLIL